MAPKRAQAKEGKQKQTRRLWTVREEEVLLLSMLNIFSDQYKAESGFKPGFFGKVETEFRTHMPNTDLKANPNIESKVKLWKEKYGAIYDLLQVSGFSWDHERHCVMVDNENVWNEYEKMHPKAKGMNGKPFPMYDGWQTLFGKDRATGETAEDPEEIPDDAFVDTPGSNAHEDLWEDCYIPRFPNGDPSFPDEGLMFGDTPTPRPTPTPPNPTTPTPRPTPTPPNPTNPTAPNPTNPTANVGANPPPKKKAKFEVMKEMMQGCMEQNDNFMDRIVKVIGFDEKLTKKRSSVFPELMKLEIEEFDRYKVNNILLAHEERVDAFFSIPDDMKQRWVEGVLNGKVTFEG